MFIVSNVKFYNIMANRKLTLLATLGEVLSTSLTDSYTLPTINQVNASNLLMATFLGLVVLPVVSFNVL